MDLANDKVGGMQILQVQILVFESDSLQPHLLGFELSGGDYSHSGTNLYHLTFVRRSEGFQQTEANLKPLLIWCSIHNTLRDASQVCAFSRFQISPSVLARAYEFMQTIVKKR